MYVPASMNNPLHLRLVEPVLPRPAPTGGVSVARSRVTGDEDDIDAMLSDPVTDLVRDIDRQITRQGPLAPELAVHATRRVAQAVISDGETRRYSVGATHVMWLGSVLYFALTGAAPLAPRPGVSSPVRPPLVASLSLFAISRDIEAIVATCLAPDRRDRFRTVAALESALAALPESATISGERLVVETPEGAAPDLQEERPTIPPASGVTLTKMAAGASVGGRRAVGSTTC